MTVYPWSTGFAGVKICWNADVKPSDMCFIQPFYRQLAICLEGHLDWPCITACREQAKAEVLSLSFLFVYRSLLPTSLRNVKLSVRKRTTIQKGNWNWWKQQEAFLLLKKNMRYFSVRAVFPRKHKYHTLHLTAGFLIVSINTNVMCWNKDLNLIRNLGKDYSLSLSFPVQFYLACCCLALIFIPFWL